MTPYRLPPLLLALFLGVSPAPGEATNLDTQNAPHQSRKTNQAHAANLPAGTFVGDDIKLTLKPQGSYVLSGDAVGTPIHGAWSVDRQGKHAILQLVPGRTGDTWSFGIRSANTLQLIDPENTAALDRPLDIYEDAGVLTRSKE
ncbi:hypothetical protein M6D76_15900 [Alcaligenes faecalis]|uniref:hypothetical protein n=1 Tax=Alcaligenes faecalis TaxID=511 RepID=UPI00211CEE03|nr:hypothetical protein [Alcaligenes faecalis]UUO10498.1 hypothetical protein M6D76_15900 [Alcaligenes faecalis]